jgi:hypothetical protein
VKEEMGINDDSCSEFVAAPTDVGGFLTHGKAGDSSTGESSVPAAKKRAGALCSGIV